MKKVLKEIMPYIIILIVVVLIRSYIITPVTVVGSSMYPNLKDKEVLLLSKISYRLHNIERFDIVVVKDDEDDRIIKRIIGLPGDKVEYKDNLLYINDELIKENYANGDTDDFTLEDICITTSIRNGTYSDDFKCSYDKIPEDYYLVLGDNRKISKDSRIIGLIPKDEIKGKTVFRIWPLKKFGTIE